MAGTSVAILAAGDAGIWNALTPALAFVGGLGAAYLTYRAAIMQSQGAARPTARAGMATWQMHKRGVYSELIAAIFGDDRGALKVSLAQSAFVANKELRATLLGYMSHEQALDDHKARIELIESLSADSRATGNAT